MNNKKIKTIATFTTQDYIKANRKASRELEIEMYGHPISFHKVFKSKKDYSRKNYRITW